MWSAPSFQLFLLMPLVAGLASTSQSRAEPPPPTRFQGSPVTIRPPQQGSGPVDVHLRIRMDDGVCKASLRTEDGGYGGLFTMGAGTYRQKLSPGEAIQLDPQGHSGEYSVQFESYLLQVSPFLVSSFGAAILVDILAPILLGLFLARRYQVRWRYWFYGMLVFLVFQGITRIPVMVFLQTLPTVKKALEQPIGFWSFLFFAAFTAGLFEEGGRWLAFRWLIPRPERQWRTALMVGAGHGGLESIGFGVVTLLGLIVYLAMALLPPGTFGNLASLIEPAREQFRHLKGWEPLLSGWERLGALAIQVGLTVLVLQAFLRSGRWWWAALGAHTLVDFTSVGVLRLVGKVWGREAGMLITEGLVTIYALVAVWLIFRLRPNRLESLNADVVGPIGEINDL